MTFIMAHGNLEFLPPAFRQIDRTCHCIVASDYKVYS